MKYCAATKNYVHEENVGICKNIYNAMFSKKRQGTKWLCMTTFTFAFKSYE